MAASRGSHDHGVNLLKAWLTETMVLFLCDLGEEHKEKGKGAEDF
jgi:hypothetical protein